MYFICAYGRHYNLLADKGEIGFKKYETYVEAAKECKALKDEAIRQYEKFRGRNESDYSEYPDTADYYVFDTQEAAEFILDIIGRTEYEYTEENFKILHDFVREVGEVL